MTVDSVFAFFVVSHLLLLHSAGANSLCPVSSDCGVHEQIKFPYSNSTYPQCRFVMVDCGEMVPKVSLALGQSYVVSGNLPYPLKINDRELKSIISNNRCDLFGYNLYIVPSPSNSLAISPCSSPSPIAMNLLISRHKTLFCGNQSHRE